MAYALIIKNEEGYNVVEHVANSTDDTVYVEDANSMGLSYSEYRKSYHLIEEVKKDHPNWLIKEKDFQLNAVFGVL